MNGTLNQAFKIARFDLGTAVRTKKAFVGILLYAGLALLVAAIWTFLQNKIMAEPGFTESMAASKDRMLEAVQMKLGADKALIQHLASLPVAVMTFFWLTQSFLPVLIAVLSSDILNREVRTKSARFVLLRASRTSLFIGKVLSHGLLLLIAAILSWMVFVIYVTINLNGFDLVAAMPSILMFLGFTLVCGFCYLGLTALVSSLIDGSGVTILVTFLILMAFASLSQSDTVGWISPSFYRYRLWSPEITEILIGLGAYVGFGALFFAGAWQRLVRRDV